MKIFATGVVHPERGGAHFPTLSWKNERDEKIAISCTASQLSITIDIPDLQDSSTGYFRVQDIANMAVSALGFTLGIGYTAEVIQTFPENEESIVHGVHAKGPDDIPLGYEDTKTVFDSAIGLGRRDVLFRMALMDYCLAIQDPFNCPVYCYRSLEAIRKFFDNWDEMHKALGTSRDEIDKLLTEHSKILRHGSWAEAIVTNNQDRAAMLKMVRDALYKYMQRKIQKP
jgi:hypothetical protein